MVGVGLRFDGLDRHVVSEPFETFDEPVLRYICRHLVEKGGAEIFVVHSAGEHLIRGDLDLVRDRHGSPPGASLRFEAPVLVFELVVLGV